MSAYRLANSVLLRLHQNASTGLRLGAKEGGRSTTNQERLQPSAAMTGQTIPSQRELVTVELATQLTDERDQTRVVVGTGSSAEHHLGF